MQKIVGPSDDAQWSAVEARDAGSDGAFVYGVATTGIYCRPSCPSRRPARRNVSFYGSAAAAEKAGFRACRRCKPDGDAPAAAHARVITSACRALEQADEQPSLAALARDAGMSPRHFHRLFRELTGVTPKAYACGARDRRLRDGLSGSSSVTSGMLDAGFGSSARFYSQADGVLGMRPTTYRAGGAGEEIRYALGRSNLGQVLVAVTAKGIAAILMGDDARVLREDLERRFVAAQLMEDKRGLGNTLAAVIALIAEPKRAANLPLDVRGSAFQVLVWEALRAIPAGKTVSYAELARLIGRPEAARAVAQACGANPAAVAIPCHRVLRGDGALSGYRWGVARKRELLRRERSSG